MKLWLLYKHNTNTLNIIELARVRHLNHNFIECALNLLGQLVLRHRDNDVPVTATNVNQPVLAVLLVLQHFLSRRKTAKQQLALPTCDGALHNESCARQESP